MGGRGSSSSSHGGLDGRLVQRANGASALGNAGTSISDRFQRNREEIGSMQGLTNEQRRAAIEEQARLANEALRVTASNPNPFATGRARTNRDRNAAGADAIADANGAMSRHMESVRHQASASRASSAQRSRAQIIQDAIANGQLSVVIDGVEWTRSSRRSRTFTRSS